VLLACVPFTTALAYPPEIREEQTHDLFAFDCARFGFPHTVRLEDTVRSRQITFYDADSDIERVEVHLLIKGAVTNVATGTRFTDRASSKRTFYPSSGELSTDYRKSAAMAFRTRGKQFTAGTLGELFREAGFRGISVTPTYADYSLVSASKPQYEEEMI
jgi:hypothetical protein